MPARRLALIVAAAIVLAVAAMARFSIGRADESRLLFVGDILLARQVQVEIERTGASPFDSVARLFAHADLVAGNFEGAIGDSTSCDVPRGSICFSAPSTAPDLLSRAGVRAVSLENNHSGDDGAAGRERTRMALASAGVLGLDFDHSPRFVRAGGSTVALVAVTLERAADGRVQAIPSVELAQKLRLARTLANLVVVSIHWGNELQEWPSVAQRRAAEWLVEHGADLVVGHHPHVVQPADCVRGRPVFFSLGNHVFDQKYRETKEGLIAACTLRARRMRCEGIRTRTRRGSSVPVPAGERDDAMASCAVPLGPSLTMSGIEVRAAEWRAADTSSDVSLEGWKDGARRWVSRQASLVSLQPRLAGDDGAELLFALERHHSSMDGELALRPHVYEVSDRGIVARWRGTTLAWPLIDAVVDSSGQVCALHRGDSFIRPDPTASRTRTMRYRWNGFGFSASDGACDAGDGTRLAAARE